MITKEDRFREKWTTEPSGCWKWTASVRPNGYGQFWDGVRVTYAHRVSYEMHNGEIPDGYVVMHSCDHKWCVNPDHLIATSQAENVADYVKKDKLTRLPKDKRRLIKELIGCGLSQSEIARKLSIPRSTVRYWGVAGVRQIPKISDYLGGDIC